MIKMMIEINCKKCKNCDMEDDCCKLYGRDPKMAVKKCANDRFKGYEMDKGDDIR